MRYVGFQLRKIKSLCNYLETSKIGDVIEGDFLDVEFEATFIADLSKGTVTVSLDLPDLDLATVTLLLVLLSQMKGHCVRVLILVILSEFERVETEALAELAEIHSLERQQGAVL